MSIEALWYCHYSARGKPPHCTRYCRMPMDQQWDLAIDIAISLCDGQAGWRSTWIVKTREVYWFWPHPLSPSGWWLIPSRVDKRVRRLCSDAREEAFRYHATEETGASVLREWKRTGCWRRHVWAIFPRHRVIASGPHGFARLLWLESPRKRGRKGKGD